MARANPPESAFCQGVSKENGDWVGVGGEAAAKKRPPSWENHARPSYVPPTPAPRTVSPSWLRLSTAHARANLHGVYRFVSLGIACPSPGVWGQGRGRERLVRAPGLLPCLQPSIRCGIAAPDARLTGKSTNLPSWVLPISLSPTRKGALIDELQSKAARDSVLLPQPPTHKVTNIPTLSCREGCRSSVATLVLE